jgi:hypothetical protein
VDGPLDSQPRIYGLQAPVRESATDTVEFDASGVAAGTYLVRLRVDDSESVPDDQDRVVIR